ncbi:MAG: hypothetical protein IPK17_30390 [Chloroflexi bacterium]|uniref:hypothetical protein n=1 Tax=Candidatus Flexifilum breve TaxID=3140694 RepID=UPI003136150F|nr:hypothetical protein [Chloroflexota bacterium]
MALSDVDVREAVRAAAYCTVAVSNERIFGYQASTMYFDGGTSGAAGRAADVREQASDRRWSMICCGFARRAITTVTVSTQLSNLRARNTSTNALRLSAQRLRSFPVWMLICTHPLATCFSLSGGGRLAPEGEVSERHIL